MRIAAFILSITQLFTIAGAAAVGASQSGPTALEPLDSTPFDTIAWAPGTAWERFEAVYVPMPEVTFRKNWQRDKNRYDSFHVRDRDVERIKGDMARMVREVVQKRFSADGWPLAEAAGDGVLVVRPNIVDLDIVAPDIPGSTIRQTYSDSAGSMTLDLLLTDGATGEALLEALDRKMDRRELFLEWRTRPYNLHQARIMVRGWADDLVELIGPRDA